MSTTWYEVAAPVSEAEREQYQCEGKVRIDTLARAREIARKSSKRHSKTVQAYKCRYCGFHHIGQRYKKQ